MDHWLALYPGGDIRCGETWAGVIMRRVSTQEAVEELRRVKRKPFLVDDLVDTYVLRYVLAVDDRTCL